MIQHYNDLLADYKSGQFIGNMRPHEIHRKGCPYGERVVRDDSISQHEVERYIGQYYYEGC